MRLIDADKLPIVTEWCVDEAGFGASFHVVHEEDINKAPTIAPESLRPQESKPLEAFLHPIDAYKGLKAKYLVFKADTGERVDNCFILRPDKDPVAVAALRAYASATDNEILAEDIYNWVGKGENVEPQAEWISVEDKLPKEWEEVLVRSECDFTECAVYLGIPGKWRVTWNHAMLEPDTITHWMPLPEPPNCGAKMKGGTP